MTYATKKLCPKTYLGKSCHRGHRGERYVSNGSCVDCSKLKFQAIVEHPDDIALLQNYADVLRAWRSTQR